jgi:hypothetical protein
VLARSPGVGQRDGGSGLSLFSSQCRPRRVQAMPAPQCGSIAIDEKKAPFSA